LWLFLKASVSHWMPRTRLGASENPLRACPAPPCTTVALAGDRQRGTAQIRPQRDQFIPAGARPQGPGTLNDRICTCQGCRVRHNAGLGTLSHHASVAKTPRPQCRPEPSDMGPRIGHRKRKRT